MIVGAYRKSRRYGHCVTPAGLQDPAEVRHRQAGHRCGPWSGCWPMRSRIVGLLTFMRPRVVAGSPRRNHRSCWSPTAA
jgi:hypothetical protein